MATLFPPMKTGAFHNESTGTLVGHRIACADDSLTRMVGLLGKGSLAAGEGLWIKPSSGIHTIGMLFPIDVIGLDRALRVVKLWPNVAPYRIPMPSLRIRSVVELAAGEIRTRRLRTGHVLSFCCDGDEQPAKPARE